MRTKFGIGFLILFLGLGWWVRSPDWPIQAAPATTAQPNQVYLPSIKANVPGKQALLVLTKLDAKGEPEVVPLNLPFAAAQDTVFDFTPKSANPGDTITLKGQGFVNVVLVLFGTIPSPSFHVTSAQVMTATVPQGALSAPISVVSLMASADSLVIGAPITATVVPSTPVPPTVAPPTPVPPTGVPPTIVPPTGVPPTVVPPTTVPPTGVPPTPGPTNGCVWICASEIMALPTSGDAWLNMKASADNPHPVDLGNQDSDGCVEVMAAALVATRLNDNNYRAKVYTGLTVVVSGNTESGARALALGRELGGCVAAADIANLKVNNPSLDAAFRTKIKALLTFPTTGGPANLLICESDRPNNWGNHCGATVLAVDRYLGDAAGVARVAVIFQGWLGDRTAYAGFRYGDLWWQSNPSAPVGINPVGGVIQGHSVDGAEPEEMRRVGTGFKWPPEQTDYAWEGLQGPMAEARMLARAGYPAWGYSNQAMLRAVKFLYGIGWSPTGDDQWQIWVFNKAYGTTYSTIGAAGHGKAFGWTAWTDAK